MHFVESGIPDYIGSGTLSCQLRADPMPDLTPEDLAILESLRLERFRQFFAESLLLATISLTLDNRLLVICSQKEADRLLEDPFVLRWFAWLTTGADEIAVYVGGEDLPVYGGCLRELRSELEQQALENLLLESNSKQGEEGMTTAVLQKPDSATEPVNSTTATASPSPASPLPLRTLDEIASELAEVTGRPTEDLKLEILNLNPAVYQFGEQFLISPDIADAAIEAYAEQLKTRLRNPRPMNNGAAKVADPALAKPAAKTAKSGTKKPSTRTTAKKTPAKTAAKKASTPKATA